MRAVLDANVLVSALLSPTGSPGRILRAWADGSFELVLSPTLVAELERTLAYPKIRTRVDEAGAGAYVRWLQETAEAVADPPYPAARSEDPGDDHLVALAATARAALVSGDRHLLALADELPVFSPRSFLELLERPPG